MATKKSYPKNTLAHRFVRAHERGEAGEFLRAHPNHSWLDKNAIVAFSDGSCVTTFGPKSGTAVVCHSIEDARHVQREHGSWEPPSYEGLFSARSGSGGGGAHAKAKMVGVPEFQIGLEAVHYKDLDTYGGTIWVSAKSGAEAKRIMKRVLQEAHVRPIGNEIRVNSWSHHGGSGFNRVSVYCHALGQAIADFTPFGPDGVTKQKLDVLKRLATYGYVAKGKKLSTSAISDLSLRTRLLECPSHEQWVEAAKERGRGFNTTPVERDVEAWNAGTWAPPPDVAARAFELMAAENAKRRAIRWR